MLAVQQDFTGIKEMLIARRTELEQRSERVKNALQRRSDPLVADASDRAIQLQNDEALNVIDDATRDELVTIGEALERLAHGLYGTCKQCGGDIEAARLRMLHAVTCATCAVG